MPARVDAIHPLWAIEGGRIDIEGSGFTDDPPPPEVRIGDARARLVFASSTRLGVVVPTGLDSGRVAVRVGGAPTAFIEVATAFATGLHQVDNPVFDRGGKATTFASLPASVAAFHLAVGPDDALYVTGPTLSSYDALYRIDASGTVTSRYAGFGRPQGVAFDTNGRLHVVEALAGVSGLYRVPVTG